jgi:hypothetical protein
MNPFQIIIKTCDDLIEADYREGFNDGVIYRIRQNLRDAGYNAEATKFWSNFCCFADYKVESLMKEWGADVVEAYGEAYKLSRGEGRFEMPYWGVK